MEIIIQFRDVIFLFIGFVAGYMLRCFAAKHHNEKMEKIIIGAIVVAVWAYNNLTSQPQNWWLNVSMGIVLAHFFELKNVKKKIGELIVK